MTGLLDYYAARAPEYDRIYAKPERQADLRAVEGWVAGCFVGRRVLEVACGTGYWTPFIAAGAQAVLATDAAREPLEIAQRRAAAPHVRFALADAYAPPRHDPPFDAAFAGFWLSHVPRSRLREFLHGLHAALAPGARVAMVDNGYVEGSSTPLSESDAEGNTYQSRTLAADGSTHRVLKNFWSDADLHAMLAGSARDVVVRRHTYFWTLEYTPCATSRSRPA